MEDARAPKAEIVTEVMAEAAEMAVAAGLVYVSDSDPGIRRLRKGKAFAPRGSASRLFSCSGI
jgi:hypothetical protein